MESRAANAAYMKRHNKQVILQLIRKAPISRAEIARKTGMTRAAVTIIIEGMLNDGIIAEGGRADSALGRRPVLIEINPEAFYTIGVNISREGCSLGIVDFCGGVKEKVRFEPPAGMGLQDTLSLIAQNIDLLFKKVNPEKLLGIGITAPGPLDSAGGVILNPPNFELWRNASIVPYFQSRFNCRIYLENNAKALALAEKAYGAGKGLKSFMELVVDTGVGAGIIIDGALYEGAWGLGCEVGHTTLNIEGETCGCGNRGCLELYASIPNIIKYARRYDSEIGSWKDIADHASQKDPICMGIAEREAEYLAAGIVNAMNILDLEAVVISGHLTYRFGLMKKLIRDRVNSRFIARAARKLELYPSMLGEDSEIISSANIVIDRYFSGRLGLP